MQLSTIICPAASLLLIAQGWGDGGEERTSPGSYCHGPDRISARTVLIACSLAPLLVSLLPAIHVILEKGPLWQSGREMRAGGGEREERKTR